MSEQQVNTFTGWALVEIMGHQRVSGYVETVTFGSVVMFRVTVPAMEPVEEVLQEMRTVQYERLGPGSRIRISRAAFETYVGVASIYRLTPCTEDQALAAHGATVEILERVPQRAALEEADDEGLAF